MKLLLYCTKAKPYLYKTPVTMSEHMFGYYHTQLNKATLNTKNLNGKIVAECDFEVEEIEKFYCCGDIIQTKTMTYEALLGRSCLTDDEFKEYNPTKAIHIKNLHIFDKPRDIRNYYNIATRTMADCMNQKALLKAPQNMCNAYDVYKNHYILISI